MQQHNLPGRPSDAGPDTRPSKEPPPDWRDLLMYAEDELRNIRRYSSDSPQLDRKRRLAAIEAAQFLLEQAAKELA